MRDPLWMTGEGRQFDADDIHDAVWDFEDEE